MTILRVACYERVSTEEQSLRGFSIETQIENLKEHCEKYQMKIVDHYTDEGVSGGKPAFKRPAMSRLIEDVKEGKIDLVIFTKLDRWFRNVNEYFKVQEILEKHNVEWKAIQEDYDTTTANGRMAITIFLAIAQNEREKTAERIKVVFDHKRKNKEACFGGKKPPLGYIKEKDENGIPRVIKDPETKDAVQDFWNILVKYNNLNKAIRCMIDQYNIVRDYKSWVRISKSSMYCGIYKGVEDYCEPYVSPEEFLRQQERRPFKSIAPSRVYLFRGMIRCPECGHVLCGSTKKDHGKEYYSYRCRNRLKTCNFGGAIAEKKLEKQMISQLREKMEAEIYRVEVTEKKPKPKGQSKLKALKERLRRLNVMYMAGNKTDEEYLREDAEIKALIAKEEASAPPPETNLVPLKELLAADFESLYNDLDREERQSFWTRIAKEILMDGKNLKDIKFF